MLKVGTRYVSPLRLYIIISLAFFTLALITLFGLNH